MFNGRKPKENEGTGKSPGLLKRARFRLTFGQDGRQISVSPSTPFHLILHAQSRSKRAKARHSPQAKSSL
jgi:hypothetical protein